MKIDWKTFEWIDLKFQEFETIEGDTRYYKISDDVLLPSMTSLLKQLDDGFLEKWRKRVGEDEADEIVRLAVKRGNALHDFSERYLKNELKRSDVTGIAKVMFNRSRPILDELGPIVGIEVPLYSIKDKYAGRVDCLAFHGKDFCVVDHKNTRRKVDLKKGYAKKKIFTYMIQTYGYMNAFAEMFPKLPKPTHGILIFANHDTMSSTKFKFPLAPLKKEFDIILNSYYGRGEIKESSFFNLK